MNSAQKFLQFALALALAGLLGACGEDLSNLNGLAQQSELNNSIGIEFTASFLK